MTGIKINILNEEQIIQLLADHWIKCGVEYGDVLLVHSSFKNLYLKIKSDYGFLISPKTVLDSLNKAIGKNGTLVLPLFNFDFTNTKSFDIRNTPSQMGALTEFARTNIQSVRTGHPVYSFLISGRQSSEFEHIDNYSGYGKDSPFSKIKELEGKIAVIGLSDQDSMTSYHFVEEQNLVEYRYFKEFEGSYTDKHGIIKEKKYAIYVRDIVRGVQTDANRMMDHLWNIGHYKGENYDTGFGMRTIKFKDMYEETQKIIKDGKALQYLYSIKPYKK